MAACALTCADAKKIDLVDYLASLGHHPQKVSHPDYWFLSPFRDEKTASFKINRQKNVWYDHSLGKGGDLIDFGTFYHNCSVSELLARLLGYQARPVLSFHPPTNSGCLLGANTRIAGEKKETTDSKIVVLDSRPLAANEPFELSAKKMHPTGNS